MFLIKVKIIKMEIYLIVSFSVKVVTYYLFFCFVLFLP